MAKKTIKEEVSKVQLTANEKNSITHKATALSKKNEVSVYEMKIKPNMDLIEEYMLAGISEEKICQAINMNYRTWRSYKDKYPSFKSAILACKMKADRRKMKQLQAEIEYIEAKPSKVEMLANLQKYIEGYPSYVYKNYERLFFMLYPEENHYLQNNITLTEVNKFDAQTRRMSMDRGVGLNRIQIVDDISKVVEADFAEIEDVEMSEEDFVSLTMEEEEKNDIFGFQDIEDVS